ncbi:alpha/beta fold hydrolase [Martelella mediterranea]|uniref:Lysophospholipase n=1 Tax=Martelella mediterranea TaxID=293089 RepID=A0A4R3NFF1_9HYPH|nr:alpha/beta hydrolase [Martelella mediterranea]TCT31095.1 lysophospholipase [Martelella mediterranea]
MADGLALSASASFSGKFSAGFMKTHDGLRLRYALFEPEAGLWRGTVVAVQGRSEFIEKYSEIVGELNEAGFAVATLDLRGQGASDRVSEDPYAGHVEAFSDFTSDVSQFVDALVRPKLKGPYFLMGHSLGGLIALSLAASGKSHFDGLLLLAPFVALHRRQLPEPLIRLLASSLSVLGLSRRPALPYRPPSSFEDQFLTSDRQRYERNLLLAKDDPPYLLGTPTFGWLRACLNETARLRKPLSLKQVKMPVLLIAPGHDVLVPFSEQVATGCRLNARILALSGAGHDILQERDEMRDRAVAAILMFLDAQALNHSECAAPRREGPVSQRQ